MHTYTVVAASGRGFTRTPLGVALLLVALTALSGCRPPCPAQTAADEDDKTLNRALSVEIDRAALETSLVERHGPAQRERIRRGLDQVLARWRPEDGDAAELRAFVEQHFIAEPTALDETFRHLEYAMEMLDGHAHEVGRELSRFQVLDERPLVAVDGLLAAYSPYAHIQEDLFKNKVGFVVLLNWPLTTLEQRLQGGEGWSRKQWAQARLTAFFEHRIPAEVLQEINRVNAAAESYIDTYNVRMDKLVPPEGAGPFRAGLKLISHWGLRDEIRGQYAAGNEGLAKQRLIARVMERIIRQEIPRQVVGGESWQWDVVQNRVRRDDGPWQEAVGEGDARYRHLLAIFHAMRRADRFYGRTYIQRLFGEQREIPEERMRALLHEVLSAPVAKKLGALIAQRLGRPLEPFDIWYTGFQAKSKLNEAELDAEVRGRYPTAKAFQKDLPNILGKIGFDAETAAFLAEHIEVDPARGAGHASGAKRRQDKAHLRTRIGKDGMDYKGFNIAIHELGHNVEQVFSISKIDHTLLEGVPNTGFTEAFAFLFQAKDLALLGHQLDDPKAGALRTLDRFWHAFEIAGVAMLDMDIWHWMYEHPEATAAETRQAMVRLAKELWNRYYAPVFGVRDVILPAIYSHIIAYGLYTPDYPLGFLITFQVEQYIKGKDLAREMERMCRLGRLAPDVWMEQAVGAPVSATPLVSAATAALDQLSGS